MKKCLVWGNGTVFFENFNLIKYHELVNNIKVIGITSAQKVFSRYEKYSFVPKSEIKDLDFDVLVIMANGKVYDEIYEEVLSLGISSEKVIKYNLLGKQWFNLEKYIELKKNPPSIFANICWGGLTYNRLNLPFLSPFVNLFVSGCDYLKFLKNPKHYIEQPLSFFDVGYSSESKKYYPIVKCGDIIIHFSHYKDFEDAKNSWERRKTRINWENLFVMMYTENEDMAKEFSKLPYEKKICFVPFKTSDKNLCYINFKENISGLENWTLVNRTARESILYYNPLDLLLEGKLVELNIND